MKIKLFNFNTECKSSWPMTEIKDSLINPNHSIADPENLASASAEESQLLPPYYTNETGSIRATAMNDYKNILKKQKIKLKKKKQSKGF